MEAAQSLPPELQQDLHFVRSAVERGAYHEGPPLIYWLWGLITLVGFSLIDYAPQWSGAYWAIAGPLGGVASWLMLRRILRRYGIADPREAAREWLQWVGMAAAILLLGFDAGRGRIGGNTLGQLILLIVGYTYYMSYVRRGDRVMLAGGLTMAAGYVVLAFASSHVWTIMGLSVFAALAGGSTFAALMRKHGHVQG
jgi:hypothetical protein